MEGTIFNIQRFCTSDGPGIRTTVFLKGCPLHCIWCHNPESHSSHAELFYNATKCISCLACVTACKYTAHVFENNTHIFRREKCVNCGACANVCPAQALENCGELITAQEIVERVARDLPFFKHSGGGLTISGGEPLFQPEFTLEICKLAKKRGIHVCVETCGYGETEHLLTLQEYVDCFLFDYKIAKEHAKAYLGIDDSLILTNLEKLSKTDVGIILRCPIIPEINDTEEHFLSIAELAQRTTNIQEIQLLPYHPLGVEKSRRIGKEPTYTNLNFLDPTRLQQPAEDLQKETKIKVTVL